MLSLYRSAASRSGRVTPSNTPYQSPNKHIRQVNQHIKSPFKHAVNKSEQTMVSFIASHIQSRMYMESIRP